MRSLGLLTACAALLLSACTARPVPQMAGGVIEPAPTVQSEWQAAIRPADARSIETLGAIWTRSLAGTGSLGRRDVKNEGALLEPGAGLDHPVLPPGSYNCRVIRLGATAGRGGIRSFPSQFCFVNGGEDGKMSIDKQTGSDLPTGWLFPDGDKRYVFLGAQQRRPGDNSIQYGSDRERDMVGVVERIGPFRWRLTVPRNDPDGLWVYELTPVPAEQQPGAAASTGGAAYAAGAKRRVANRS